MSLFMRIIFFGLIGIIAGMLAWPFAELILYYQAYFPTLLLFNIVLGISIGLFLGGCFGTSEGVLARSSMKIKTGSIMGIIIGMVGGLVGFVAGQAALLLIGTTFFNSTSSFQKIGFPISKAIGWATFGICIGIVEGIRSKSLSKARNGVIGGCIGGILGGLGVEYIRLFSPENFYARLIGLVILGFLIGIFYGFIENKLAQGSLRLLNGKNRGKEFLLTQKLTRVGESEKTEVGLDGYNDVASIHAEIRKDRDGFVLTDAGSKRGTFINDGRADKKRLQNGDIIRVGNAQFQFTEK